MTGYDLLRDFWATIIAAVSAVIWFTRLEAKSRADQKANEKELTRLQDQRNADVQHQRQARSEDREEARLSRAENIQMLSEVREDVKNILKEMGRNR